MTVLGSGRDPLEELAEEFAARYRRGERPSLVEYVQRYPDLADEIREIFPALVMLEDVRPVSVSVAGADHSAPGQLPFHRLGEYRIVREIGRGGMGVVYEAEQESLGRRVAIKVLPPGALADPRQVERFRREARAAARLHHTNLVPLFGVGEEGATHYYVMQYIEGCPLDDVLHQLRRLRYEVTNEPAPSDRASEDEKGSGGMAGSAGSLSSAEVARSLWTGQFRTVSRQSAPDTLGFDSSSRSDLSASSSSSMSAPDSALTGPKADVPPGSPSDSRRPYLRSVAHLGVQVADALEYAAGQGILHRDVKPSNLLLDRYGTVWLTDFGLAKATGTQDLTHTGDLFGTLRYMAPERFRGQSDVRSDVYGLGLTLYELLALHPAFDDRGQAQLVRHITLDEPPRLDTLNLSLPRDLVTIVHKATAKDPGDRYQTPGSLAEDLRRFLEDRPILARRLNVMEQAWRWCRRNPASAALVGLLLFLAGFATMAAHREQQQRLEMAKREARVRQAVEEALEQASGLRSKGLWAEAGMVLAQAELRLFDAQASDLGQRLGQARAELELVTRLENNRIDHRIGSYGQKTVRDSVAQGYAVTFARAGFEAAEPGREAAVAARIRRSEVWPSLVAALDDWAFVTSNRTLRARLLQIARLADPDPLWSNRARDPALWEDRQALEQLTREVPAKDPSPRLLTTLGVLLQEAGGDPEPLLRAAQERRPSDFWLNYELGMLLRSKKPAEALGYARAALVARPESSMAHNLLGLALWADHRLPEAKAALRRAIELDPRSAAPHANLGAILTQEENLEEALTVCRKAVELDPSGGVGFANLGGVLSALGRSDEALAAFRKAIAFDPKLGVAYNDLGNLLLKLNQRDAAVAAYRKAIEVSPKLAAAHYNLGNHFANAGRIVEALAAYRRAVEFDPSGVMAHKALGDTLIREGRCTEASAEARRWIEFDFSGDSRVQEVRDHWRFCERLLALNAKLPAFLEGKARAADVSQERELALLCLFYKRYYAAACRFYAAALSAEPNQNASQQILDRYNAACAAALAASGKGGDADRLDEPARAALRQQALGWLRTNLDLWAKPSIENVNSRQRLAQDLRHWQRDDDLAGIRDPGALARLPEHEQAACRKLWQDVRALIEKAEGSPTSHSLAPSQAG